MSVSETLTRRRFLHGAALATAASAGALPLSANAEGDLSPPLNVLNAYAEWLYLERRTLAMQMYPGQPEIWNCVPCSAGISESYSEIWEAISSGSGLIARSTPVSRAPHILSAAGVDVNRVEEF